MVHEERKEGNPCHLPDEEGESRRFKKQLTGLEKPLEVEAFVESETERVKRLGEEEYLKRLVNSQPPEMKRVIKKGPLAHLLS